MICFLSSICTHIRNHCLQLFLSNSHSVMPQVTWFRAVLLQPQIEYLLLKCSTFKTSSSVFMIRKTPSGMRKHCESTKSETCKMGNVFLLSSDGLANFHQQHFIRSSAQPNCFFTTHKVIIATRNTKLLLKIAELEIQLVCVSNNLQCSLAWDQRTGVCVVLSIERDT